MNYIVGDIGNTATKICLLNHKFIIIKSIIFDTNKIFNKGYFKNIMLIIKLTVGLLTL